MGNCCRSKQSRPSDDKSNHSSSSNAPLKNFAAEDDHDEVTVNVLGNTDGVDALENAEDQRPLNSSLNNSTISPDENRPFYDNENNDSQAHFAIDLSRISSEDPADLIMPTQTVLTQSPHTSLYEIERQGSDDSYHKAPPQTIRPFVLSEQELVSSPPRKEELVTPPSSPPVYTNTPNQIELLRKKQAASSSTPATSSSHPHANSHSMYNSSTQNAKHYQHQTESTTRSSPMPNVEQSVADHAIQVATSGVTADTAAATKDGLYLNDVAPLIPESADDVDGEEDDHVGELNTTKGEIQFTEDTRLFESFHEKADGALKFTSVMTSPNFKPASEHDLNKLNHYKKLGRATLVTSNGGGIGNLGGRGGRGMGARKTTVLVAAAGDISRDSYGPGKLTKEELKALAEAASPHFNGGTERSEQSNTDDNNGVDVITPSS